MRKIFKNRFSKPKTSLFICIILRILTVISLFIEFGSGNIKNGVLCIVVLIIFTLPPVLYKSFGLVLPDAMETAVYVFIFSSAILGEINNFYGFLPFWDTILHVLSGFILAGVGFSLARLMNGRKQKLRMSALYIALTGICFSLTAGLLWEFFEFTCDNWLRTDMQKDKVIKNISSVELNGKNENEPLKIDDITRTEIYFKNGERYTVEGGYLDTGLNDTMKDLSVNFIGAVIFCTAGFYHMKNRGKYEFVNCFIPVKKEEYCQ